MSVSFLTPSFDVPSEPTRAPVEGSLAHGLLSGATTAALTFAGQGWPWWDDLVVLLDRRSWLRNRALEWSATIAELVADPLIRDLGGHLRRLRSGAVDRAGFPSLRRRAGVAAAVHARGPAHPAVVLP